MRVVHIVETGYNFDSTVNLEDLMLECKQHGMESVIVADHHKMYHMVDLEICSRKYGIKVVFGCRVSVKNGNDFFEAILIAKNNKGLENISALSSKSHFKGDSSAYITSEELNEHKDGIIPVLVFKGNSNEDLLAYSQIVKGLQKTFDQNDVYLELHLSSSQDVQRAKGVKWLSDKFNVPMVASNRVCFLKKEDAIVREIRRSIKNGDVVREGYNQERYFKTYEEMQKVYGVYEHSIGNTVQLADKAEANVTLKGDAEYEDKPLIFDVPKNIRVPKNLTAFFKPIEGYQLPSDPEELRAIAYLCKLALDGFKMHYKPDNIEARERIKYELGVIIGQNFTHYFLVVWDFIRYCIDNNIPIGPGRGSSAGSVLARCLNIIKLDPILHGLLFERFLNPERISKPDIDIDMSNELRYAVIQYAKKKYGSESVAQIVTFGKFGTTNAVRYVRKALKLSQELEAKILKLIPKKTDDLIALVQKKEGQALLELSKKDETVRRVLTFASKLQNLPSHTSTNAAGLIVTNGDIGLQIPVTVGTDETGEKIYLTQISNSSGQLELVGYTKIDFLGLKNVDIPNKTEKWIKVNHGIESITIPIDDVKTFELYQSGNLTGVFQMDSEGMQKTCRTVKPENIQELMDILALYRPGPMEEIKTYAKNKFNKLRSLVGTNNQELVGVEDLEPILEKTHGIIVYQEQIIMIASVWAGYTLGQADLLRQAISKKDVDKMLEEKERFARLSAEKGRSPKTTEEIYNLILRFAQYGFNKSHAAVYAQQSFTNAWYKTHFPIEFMATRISASMDDTSTASKYVTEAVRMGIHVQKPDIRYSSDEFIPTKEGIIFGLPMVKDVGLQAVSHIVKERNKAPFVSFEDFLKRMDSTVVNKKAIGALVKVGAFDCFGSRKSLLDLLEGKVDETDFNVYRFHEIEWLGLKEEENKDDFTKEEKREFEAHHLGFTITEHPLASRKNELEQMIRSKDFGHWVYGSVGQIKKKKDKNKNDMADLMLDKIDGQMTLVVFKDLWRKIHEKTAKGQIVLCRIKAENETRAILNEIEFL